MGVEMRGRQLLGGDNLPVMSIEMQDISSFSFEYCSKPSARTSLMIEMRRLTAIRM
jgi:hypothetical protein